MAGSGEKLGPPSETTVDLEELNDQLEQLTVVELLEWAHQAFGSGLVMATGFGPSGVVLIHHIAQMSVSMPVFYIDTDLLFPSTYRLRDELTDRFGLSFLRLHSGVSMEEQSELHGDELWARDPDRCCNIRKVTPLRLFLQDKEAWVTGLRRDQSRERADTQIIEWDARNQLYKLNPLAGWTLADVWSHIHRHRLPYNDLHEHGYKSIGCTPCTRPIGNGDGERDGRWPGTGKTECGIHRRKEAV